MNLVTQTKKPNHKNKHSGIYHELDSGTNLGVYLGVEPDIGPSTNKNLGTGLYDDLGVNIALDLAIGYGISTSFGNEEHSVNSINGSVFWSKFAPFRI